MKSLLTPSPNKKKRVYPEYAVDILRLEKLPSYEDERDMLIILEAEALLQQSAAFQLLENKNVVSKHDLHDWLLQTLATKRGTP